MGVHNGYKLLFALGGLTFSQLCSVGHERAKEAGHSSAPAIICDISWLCHKLLSKKTMDETMVIITVLILKFVEEENFGFYAAFDPDGHHHMKKALVCCKFKHQESITACIMVKSKILLIARDLQEGNLKTEQEKNILWEKLKKLEKEVKKGKKAIEESQKHPKIMENVWHTIEELLLWFPGNIIIVKGMFQADSYIQHLMMIKSVDFAIGNDANFSVIAGDTCLQMTNFQISVMRKMKNGRAMTNVSVSNVWVSELGHSMMQLSHCWMEFKMFMPDVS